MKSAVIDFCIGEHFAPLSLIESSGFTIGSDNQKYPVDDFISLIDQYDRPVMFVRNLSKVFQSIIEPMLIKNGFECKYCTGETFHPYTPPLKEKQYAPMIFGFDKVCMSIRFQNFKVYDTAPWLNSKHSFMNKLTREEIRMFDRLSEDTELKMTPSLEAWKRTKADITLSRNKIDLDIYQKLLGAYQGGIIQGLTGYYPEAFHYDVTSLYPFIVSITKRLPDMYHAFVAKEQMKVYPDCFAYWIRDENDGRYHCLDDDRETVPAGAIMMPLSLKNPYCSLMEAMFFEKNQCSKGQPEYEIRKKKINSFIGRIGKRMKENVFFPYCIKDEGRIIDKESAKRLPGYYKKDDPHVSNLAAYQYIIARSRIYMRCLIANAYERTGMNVIQINTDGFFTDIELPEEFYSTERYLGSLRFEYKAHDLIVFASNQYTCKEETCISGLASNYYDKKHLTYSIPILRHDYKKNVNYYSYQQFTLGGYYNDEEPDDME